MSLTSAPACLLRPSQDSLSRAKVLAYIFPLELELHSVQQFIKLKSGTVIAESTYVDKRTILRHPLAV
jgi:hypothetical protein